MVSLQYSDQFATVEKLLQKKNTFSQGVADLNALILSIYSSNSLVANLGFVSNALTRVFTLLKSRFTSPTHWKSGRKLALSTQSLVEDPQLSQQLESWIQQCDEVLAEEGVQDESSAAPRPFFFEGQLSTSEGPPLQQPGSDSIEALLQQLAGRFQADAQAGAPDGAAQPGPEDLRQREEVEARLIAAMSEAGLLEEGTVPKRAPPASESAVKALKVEKLTEHRIRELGGGTHPQCSVCQEDLQVDESVQVMPCSSSHVFHVPCLAPWLKENNSCPVCRHELRTDDEQYELEKGARNAQSHNEFCYI